VKILPAVLRNIMKWMAMSMALCLWLPQGMEAKKSKDKSEISFSQKLKKKKAKIKKAKTKLESQYQSLKQSLKNHLQSTTQFEEFSKDEKQAYLVYVQQLLEGIDRASIEELNEACDLLGVNSTHDIREALALVMETLQEPSGRGVYFEGDQRFELCATYIGDDGIEYTDEDDEAPIEEVSFYCLPIHQWEKKVIEKIVTAMGEKRLDELMWNQSEMKKWGKQIHHVHPLRFLGHVFSDSYLKSCVQRFRGSSFKWDNFIDGYASRMREEAASANLEKHVQGFCDFMRIDLEPVQQLVSVGNYEGLVIHLLQL